MILLTLAPGPKPYEVTLRCPWDDAATHQIKAMPGARWDRGGKAWVLPWDAASAVCETLTAAGVAKVQPGDQWLLAGPFGVTCVIACPGDYFPFQREGAAWCASALMSTGAALLADEMGVGKTPQAIAALDAVLPLEGVRVVVCPAIVVPHWEARIKRWAQDPTAWRVLSYEGFQTAIKGGSKKIQPLPPHVGAVCLDEAHYVSNHRKATRAKTIAAWLGAHPSCKRLLLTGTPMTTRPRDLWHLLEIMHPGRWGTAWQFEKRYCGGRFEEIPNVDRSVWVADGISQAPELAARLRTVMLRRTKVDVALQLPPRTREVTEVTLPRKALASLTRAAHAIDWHGGKHAGVASVLSNIEAYKIDAAVALATTIRDGGGRCLILTTRKATAKLLGEALGCPSVDGDTPVADRQATLAHAPQTHAQGVATIYSVTTGIDLVGYDHLIFVGLDWVPSTLLQAEARVHRIGQGSSVTIHYLIGRGTLDEIVRERVIERLDTFEAVAGGGDGVGLSTDLAGGSDDDLIAALVAAVKEAA